MTEPYAQGGVIPGEPVPLKLQPGERLIQTDGTILELTPIENGYRWARVGKIDVSSMLNRLNLNQDEVAKVINDVSDELTARDEL